jgi:hypothetical protein
MFDRMSNVDTDAELRSSHILRGLQNYEEAKVQHLLRKNLKVGSRTILILTLGNSSEDPD